MIEPNANYVPKIAWEYWGLVGFCAEYPGLYSMDEKRVECHNRLCQHYDI